MNVLVVYWLKTVCKKGYTRDEWEVLDRLIKHTLAGKSEPHSRQALLSLQAWIHESSVQRQASSTSTVESPRRSLNAATLMPYLVRLINEWLPVEVSRLLVEEAETRETTEPGIPAIAIARAFERLIRREHLTSESLEALLDANLVSPTRIYPGDYELFRDAILYVLGRTEAAAFPVLPATLMFVAPGATLSEDHVADAVELASLAQGEQGDELHVPIAAEQAFEALAGDRIRITSRLVTMDGRWWDADKLRSGREQNVIVYRPTGNRVEIDYSGDHARIRIPWPEAQYSFSGPTHFGPVMEMFGREWHISRLEQDAEHTWVDLVFSRRLKAAEMRLEAVSRRSAPAGVDLGWAALQDALAVCLEEKKPDAVEKLRREEMIPLARAIVALMEAVTNQRLRKIETIEPRIRAIGYFAATLQPTYGPVRWSVLPEPVRKILSSPRLYGALYDALNEVFEGLPAPPKTRVQGLPSGMWLRRLFVMAEEVIRPRKVA